MLRLPRASGDGPWSENGRWSGHEAAPRERGWTLHRSRDDIDSGGCPARAGMDPYLYSEHYRGQGLPRASGDGPSLCCCRLSLLAAAPRERGWTQGRLGLADGAHGCPARAGMDPTLPHRPPTGPGLPRASGDGPHAPRGPPTSTSAAPRERGWTRDKRCRYPQPRGCPARAGMDPSKNHNRARSQRLPRASGDGPRSVSAAPWRFSAAPRERGWTFLAQGERVLKDGCPARAGMDPDVIGNDIATWWLPRASGDGPLYQRIPPSARAAAPRERGWTQVPRRQR